MFRIDDLGFRVKVSKIEVEYEKSARSRPLATLFTRAVQD